MITFYNKNETAFTHNGLGVLDDYIIKPVVTEEINGIFKLEFDYPTHAPHGDGLTPERIVRAPVPDMNPQLFRIAEREASIGGLFHVVAFHVFYDLSQNLIEDTNIVYKNGAQAMAQLLGATQFSHGFCHHRARVARPISGAVRPAQTARLGCLGQRNHFGHRHPQLPCAGQSRNARRRCP